MILKKQKVEEHLSSQFLCESGAPNTGKLQLGGFLFFSLWVQSISSKSWMRQRDHVHAHTKLADQKAE